MILVGTSVACSFKDAASSGRCWGVNIESMAAVAYGEYAGGGAFEGTVKAFMP